MKKIRNPENIDFKKHPIPPGYVVVSEKEAHQSATDDGWLILIGNQWRETGHVTRPWLVFTYLRPTTKKPTNVTVTHPEVSALKAALKGFSTKDPSARGKWIEIGCGDRPSVRQLTRCDDGYLRDSSGKRTYRVAGAYYKRIGR